MANIRDMLGRFLSIPGVRSAVLVGRDGLPIETAGRGEVRFLEALGAMGASALGTAEALGADLGHGPTVAAMLEFEDAFVSVDPLGAYAAVVTLAETAASLGAVRRAVRGSRDELMRQLDLTR